MRVLVAPDKFKGSLTAGQVAEHIAHGLRDAGADPHLLPMADGGDGSVAAALAAGMQRVTCTVADAVGVPHDADIAFDGRTAVVEIANTCGLAALQDSLAPLSSSTRGFGEAIRHAAELGATTIVLALGGSASTDGGTGMLAALGYSFTDADGIPVEPQGRHLQDIRHVDARGADDLRGIDLVVAGDVTNPLTGTDGAAAVFGPQKGASSADVDDLERGLESLVDAFRDSGFADAPRWAAAPGSGAAGGCGFATLVIGARIASGADFFLDLLGFDAAVADADLVVTGEGRLDAQTLGGKLPAVVALRSAPRRVIAVVGRNELAASHGPFGAVYAVADRATGDTATDPRQTAAVLRAIGGIIARSSTGVSSCR